MTPSTFNCFHLPSSALICLHCLLLPSSAFFCLHQLSFAFSRLHLLLFTFIQLHLPSSTFNCLLSFAFICLHLHVQLQRRLSAFDVLHSLFSAFLYAFICICLSTFTFVCLHLSSPAFNFVRLDLPNKMIFIQWSLHPNKSEV